jgi:hypothetical protein
MEEINIRFVGDMTKLKLEPGDMLVLQLDAHISDEQFECLNSKMAKVFGKGRVVVLDKGMKLGAVNMPQDIYVDGNGNAMPSPPPMQRKP